MGKNRYSLKILQHAASSAWFGADVEADRVVTEGGSYRFCNVIGHGKFSILVSVAYYPVGSTIINKIEKLKTNE